MDEPLLSTGEVARLLDIRHYRMEYLLSTGVVPEPARRVAGKRAWSQQEIDAARQAIQEKQKAKNAR
ncbi:MAG: hypothetical protein HS116_05915 [Planctomycetes bacterium]|nr:hypothetical protein [Planctomycetota bacterium]